MNAIYMCVFVVLCIRVYKSSSFGNCYVMGVRLIFGVPAQLRGR